MVLKAWDGSRLREAWGVQYVLVTQYIVHRVTRARDRMDTSEEEEQPNEEEEEEEAIRTKTKARPYHGETWGLSMAGSRWKKLANIPACGHNCNRVSIGALRRKSPTRIYPSASVILYNSACLLVHYASIPVDEFPHAISAHLILVLSARVSTSRAIPRPPSPPSKK